jgi:hypothetical protein
VEGVIADDSLSSEIRKSAALGRMGPALQLGVIDIPFSIRRRRSPSGSLRLPQSILVLPPE